MSFPLLPSRISSSYQYDRLKEYSEGHSIDNNQQNNFKKQKKNFIEKLKNFFQLPEEKFLRICLESGKITDLKRILKRHSSLTLPENKVKELSYYSSFFSFIFFLL